MKPLMCIPIEGMPQITSDMSLSACILEALDKNGQTIEDGDLLVTAHKVVSKEEGRVAYLPDIIPSKQAKELGERCGKDPRFVQLILEESETVDVDKRNILMCRRKDGWVCCNAGLDQSNAGGEGKVVLLPLDSDASAKRLSGELYDATGRSIAVLISDTHGRVLRDGIAGVTVGSYGLEPIKCYIGEPDGNGRVMHSSREAVADEICGMASLVMGQGEEKIPCVLIRGYAYEFSKTDSFALKREEGRQLFLPLGERVKTS